MHSASQKPVIIWLLIGCLLVYLMVLLGGITRLTHSGLSITEWKVIMGTLPPLNEDQWQLTFEKYQQSPEFKIVNNHYTLAEFKSIFWWEYLHRLLGRIIGLVFLIPFIYFLLKKKLDKKVTKNLVVIFLLGGLQGFLGWFMVKSGLVKNPDVSHYRLAAHLITAFAVFGYIFWVVLNLVYPPEKNISTNTVNSIRKISKWLFAVVILQIIYGAFVAGLNAGLIYNTFPKMGTEWIPESVTALNPFWKNFIEGLAGVQFTHRYLAYTIVVLVFTIWYKGTKITLTERQQQAITLLVMIVLIQFLLGMFTLLYSVPLVLGVLHQTGAFVLFSSAIYLLHSIKKN